MKTPKINITCEKCGHDNKFITTKQYSDKTGLTHRQVKYGISKGYIPAINISTMVNIIRDKFSPVCKDKRLASKRTGSTI